MAEKSQSDASDGRFLIAGTFLGVGAVFGFLVGKAMSPASDAREVPQDLGTSIVDHGVTGGGRPKVTNEQKVRDTRSAT